MQTISINGKTGPSSEFDWLNDSGFKYGYGAFETIRMQNKKALFLSHHINRLNHALSKLGIPYHATLQQLEQKISALIHSNDQSDGVIHMYITGGKLSMSPQAKSTPSEIISISPLPPTIKPLSIEFKQVNPHEFFKLKSLNYAHHMLASQLSPHWTVYIDEHDIVIDSSLFSIGCIKGNHIVFPTHDFQLPSISRHLIIENLLKNEKNEANTPINVRQVTKNELCSSDAIFGSNVIRGIVPLEYKISSKKQHPMVTQLKNKWTHNFFTHLKS